MKGQVDAAAIVSIQHLTKGFNGRTVLEDVSFEARDGEFVSLVGPSGCGKTTLLRILAGLEPYTDGRVLVDSAPVAGPSGSCAVVFQSDSLLPWRTVERNAALGLELRDLDDDEHRRRLSELLDLVGLAQAKKQFPRQLSGGMRQRANLARALAVDPDVLLMDEPFAALDAYTRETLQTELLRIWAASARKTVVFITHQLDEAVFLSDSVIALGVNPGRILDRVQINLPRPRTAEMKHSTELAEYVQRLWRLIEGDRTRDARSRMTV